ncbi:hypothetical protein [Fischerella sp. PCC 9605]|uniref:hypothetical protein n=1 Tax=Fischerella sp. PCC 9605 TaxID=1173024 RepID=UPI0012DD47C1|nr:hypothetical protein [Fischerella sp. PCC 9605]
MGSPTHRFCYVYRRLQAWFILSITIVFLTLAIYPADAQQSSLLGNQVDGYPIVLDGNILFRVRQGIPGVASAEERANVINDRLTRVANDDSISPETIRVEEQDDASVVFALDTVLFTVRDSDREGNQSVRRLHRRPLKLCNLPLLNIATIAVPKKLCGPSCLPFSVRSL